jgi:AcrR family transcriptional regulator
LNQREQQRLETRRTLASHALRLFRANGFDETTVEEIAAAAGVSKRTFFLHFPTKAAAAFPDHEQRVADFAARLGNGADRTEPLSHLLHTLLTGIDAHSPMRRTRYQLLATVGALRDEDARTDRDYEDVIAGYLRQGWGDSAEAKLRARAVANAVIGVVRASLIAWSEQGIDPQRVCYEILHRMLGAPFDVPLQSVQPIDARRASARARRLNG